MIISHEAIREAVEAAFDETAEKLEIDNEEKCDELNELKELIFDKIK